MSVVSASDQDVRQSVAEPSRLGVTAFLLLRLSVYLYVILSALSQVDELEASNIASRIIPADMFMLALIAAAFPIMLRQIFGLRNLTVVWFSLFLGAMLVSAMFAHRPDVAFRELVVYTFCFVGGITWFMLLSQLNMSQILIVARDFTYAAGIMAGVALLSYFGLIGAVESVAGVFTGTFRNSGQAGFYFGVALCIAVPMYLQSKGRDALPALIVVGALVLALALSVKRSVLIGTGVSLALMVMVLPLIQAHQAVRKILLIIPLALLAGGLIAAAKDVASIDATLEWRLRSKIYDVDLSTIGSEGFLAENWGGAIEEFVSSPIIGVGIGNTTGSHEIHSTYFGILAYGGLAAAVPYAGFLLTFLARIWGAIRARTDTSIFFAAAWCFMAGQAVTWAYSLHIRKREFWFVFALLLAMAYIARQSSVLRARHQSAPVGQSAG